MAKKSTLTLTSRKFTSLPECEAVTLTWFGGVPPYALLSSPVGAGREMAAPSGGPPAFAIELNHLNYTVAFPYAEGTHVGLLLEDSEQAPGPQHIFINFTVTQANEGHLSCLPAKTNLPFPPTSLNSLNYSSEGTNLQLKAASLLPQGGSVIAVGACSLLEISINPRSGFFGALSMTPQTNLHDLPLPTLQNLSLPSLNWEVNGSSQSRTIPIPYPPNIAFELSLEGLIGSIDSHVMVTLPNNDMSCVISNGTSPSLDVNGTTFTSFAASFSTSSSVSSITNSNFSTPTPDLRSLSKAEIAGVAIGPALLLLVVLCLLFACRRKRQHALTILDPFATDKPFDPYAMHDGSFGQVHPPPTGDVSGLPHTTMRNMSIGRKVIVTISDDDHNGDNGPNLSRTDPREVDERRREEGDIIQGNVRGDMRHHRQVNRLRVMDVPPSYGDLLDESVHVDEDQLDKSDG